ncbi:MAG: LuxR family transcriptional regulator, partial [Acidimicrobiia bacterium]|nr:LuxR family transcriptional regulator [Acidimicrobiia bacterium]
MLDGAVQRRLTLVVAPPGYGKTILLRQWAGSSVGQCLGWITVGPEANGSGRL